MSENKDVNNIEKQINCAEQNLEKLRIEYKTLKQALEAQKYIKTLEQYTDDEKIEKFNLLYNMALAHLGDVQEDSNSDDDTTQWFFEAVMELLSKEDGSGIWDYYNKLL